MSDRRIYMKTTRECYEALLAGKTLIGYDFCSVSLRPDGSLHNGNFTFDEPEKWYIKPEPRVVYLNEYEHGPLRGEFRAYSSENYAMLGRVSSGYVRTVKYIEVVE